MGKVFTICILERFWWIWSWSCYCVWIKQL